MSFTFTNYAGIMPQKSPWEDAIGNLLGGYSDMTKARYLQPSLQEALTKEKLHNKYYGPNIESQIGLRGAQTQQAHAHTGLLGEQLRGARIENQYLPQKMQAAIELSRAGAQKARLMQMIREQLLGGNQAHSPQQYDQTNAAIPENNTQEQQFLQNTQPSGQKITQGAPGYAQAATAMQMLGLGKPHLVNVDGKQVAITPFGNIDTGVQAPSEREKELSKLDVKSLGNLEETVLNNASRMDTFNELNGILGSDSFEGMRRNPILGRHELGWYAKFGTPEQQNIVAQAQTLMGNIIKDSARDFAGPFRVAEQSLLNSMKPNASDTLDSMKGKSEALTFLLSMNNKRAEMAADLIRNKGMSPLAAKIATDNMLNPKQIKQEIHGILHPKKQSQITPDMARAELERRRAQRGNNG